jgi:trans-2,3-dihydro-3-hydroxyanthranilate isomerase
MSDKIKFYIADVFGKEKYSGNQLATFLDCGHLSGKEMQAMAREINFSESTFILSNEQQENGGYDVRIFTPGAEVDFAGHPTLGTAYIIQQHLSSQPVEKVVLNLKVGQIPVFFLQDETGESILWMKQVEPIFKENLEPSVLARVLDLEESDIDAQWPVQQVSTGLPQVIVPLKSSDALNRAAVQKGLFWELCEQWWAKSILIFCPGGYTEEQQLKVRVFVDYYNIPEDPATGSGNGCLAAYLVKNRYFGTSSIDIKTGQGYKIGRPSTLYLKASEENGSINVSVGGQVVPIAEGYWG